MLEPLTTNECTIKDSFTFTKELQSFYPKLAIASFDIDSLSTFLCKKQLTSILKTYLNIGLMLIICPKDSFRELLTRNMSESLILFDQGFYKQHDEVGMDSPLGPTLSNRFSLLLWKNVASEMPFWISRYVDDTFLPFRSKRLLDKFQNYLNHQHKSIRFTSKTVNENSISFLDIKISRK